MRNARERAHRRCRSSHELGEGRVFLLVWIGLSVPMAFLVGRILRRGAVPVPDGAVADAACAPKGRGPAVPPGAALASEAARPSEATGEPKR